MKAHDDNAEKKAQAEKEAQEQKLVEELLSLVEKHLPIKVGKKFKASLSAGLLKKSPEKMLKAFRIQIEDANQKYKDDIVYKGSVYKGGTPFFNPKDPQYKEKTLIHKQFPSILQNLADKGAGAALAEAKGLTGFLDSQAIAQEAPRPK